MLRDEITDLQGRVWYLNDRVRIVRPGVRTDDGRIVELASPALVRVELLGPGDRFVGYTHGLTKHLELVRRRTADEAPILD